MTDKELRKLNRRELMELMNYMRQEIDALRNENEKLNRRLDALINDETAPLPPEPEAELEMIVNNFFTHVSSDVSNKE